MATVATPRQVTVRYSEWNIEPAEEAGYIACTEYEDSRITRETLTAIVREVDQLGEAELVELVNADTPDTPGQLAVMYWGMYPQRARDIARNIANGGENE